MDCSIGDQVFFEVPGDQSAQGPYAVLEAMPDEYGPGWMVKIQRGGHCAWIHKSLIVQINDELTNVPGPPTRQPVGLGDFNVDF